jgi:transcriptional regulator with XRE-family HTH domain
MDSPNQPPSSIHDPEYHKIINALISLREAAKLSQTSLALELGLTQPDVSKIERRERRIDVLEALRWIRATGSDPSEFFAPFAKLEH